MNKNQKSNFFQKDFAFFKVFFCVNENNNQNVHFWQLQFEKCEQTITFNRNVTHSSSVIISYHRNIYSGSNTHCKIHLSAKLYLFFKFKYYQIIDLCMFNKKKLDQKSFKYCL